MNTLATATPINEALRKMHIPISVDVEETDDALGSFMVFTTLTSEERRDSFAYKGSPKLAPTPIPVSSSATYGVVKHALNL